MNDTIYCYPDSDVLINKLGVRDQEVLSSLERRLTMLRIMDLVKTPLGGNFDFTHLCGIHQYIFQDLYFWAGECRSVEIAKGAMFCRAELLRREAARIFGDLSADLEKGKFRTEDAAECFSYHFSEINALHPFREGNGRAQREFIRELALSQGYLLEFSKISAEEMLFASRESFLCRYEPMTKVFALCLRKI